MSVRIVRVKNPDGTTTDVSMVCIQSADGNNAKTKEGSNVIDERTCQFGPSASSSSVNGNNPFLLSLSSDILGIVHSTGLTETVVVAMIGLLLCIIIILL